jgi:hypothetical protein
VAAQGDSVVLECTVDAYPEPKMMFWRDHSGRVPVIQGGNYDINIQPAKDVRTDTYLDFQASSTLHVCVFQFILQSPSFG